MANPIVRIEEGQIRGKTDQNYQGGKFYSFLGVPYAKAPIGDLRFKAPIPVEAWDGIKDATKEGPECPSRNMFFFNKVGCEDNCLNLNIYTPNLPECNSGNKPVMVWIHGGGFLYGSNKRELYGPEYLLTEDIVLVVINYRIGIFGFLSFEDSSLEVPGNAGLKDMVLALKWIQRNIKHFGGDPSNVTIFGESAGSASVHYLYLSPLANGLFHKAIAQSGVALNPWAQGIHNGKLIAENLNLKETQESEILQKLKTIPPFKIVEAQHKKPDVFEAAAIRPFGPVIEKATEGAFLTENPLEILKSGKFNQVPLIIGYNSSEGMFFEAIKKLQIIPTPETISFEKEIPFDVKQKLTEEKSQEISKKIKEYYYGNEEPNDKNSPIMFQLKTDNMFLLGIHRSLTLQKTKSNHPIFFYKMSLDTPANQFKRICVSKNPYLLMFLNFLCSKLSDGYIKNSVLKLAMKIPRDEISGTSHADDLNFLFKTFMSEKIQTGSPEDIHIKRFVKLWTNFARTSNPTPIPDDLLGVEWKPITNQENYLLNIGDDLTMEVDPDLERVKFWEQILEY